jgi:DNA mismatch repair ATPase MutS
LIPPAARVTNDFEIRSPGEVEILTGSNMAGKSTFLKTIGMNLCLAYAGAPVIASCLRAQPLRLYACIRITDSIVDGFSYFYAEVKCLKGLLEALEAADDLPLLFLVDEIYRGTNNRERFIGSRAFIRAVLGKRGVGLIATHDLELAHLAEANALAHNYHFRDDVRDGRLVFDYRLREGPCPTTNALKIMELEGLPVDETPARS